MTDPPEVPDLTEGLSREDVHALRASLDRDERDRVERTVAELLDLLGNAHAMAILGQFAFAEGPLRFGEIEEELDIAPNTLSTRLSELTEAGLLERRAYDETPPRVEYAPSEKGAALVPVFRHLYYWATEHDI